MKNIFKYTFLFCLLSTFACKKKDSISNHTISGQVYNLCTDSGIGNITVYIRENGGRIAQTVSSVNGNFTLSNVSVHSNSDYKYEIYIPSVNGSGTGPEIGIDGFDLTLDKSKIGQSIVCNVVPHLKMWNLYFPVGTSLTVSDTFTLMLQQNIFRKNNSSGKNVIAVCNSPAIAPPDTNYIGGINDYPMGWWYSTLDKTKSGTHIITKDSFYVGYGAIKTDTIPW
jgi:hypothetical protein